MNTVLLSGSSSINESFGGNWRYIPDLQVGFHHPAAAIFK
jgi:hypothetical protein